MDVLQKSKIGPTAPEIPHQLLVVVLCPQGLNKRAKWKECTCLQNGVMQKMFNVMLLFITMLDEPRRKQTQGAWVK